MITGVVTSEGEATITVRVHGPLGADQDCPVIIDTGFNGFLALPGDWVARLELAPVGSARAILGDGHSVDLLLFEAVVVWHGQQRSVDVLASEGGALVGMALLRGSNLSIDVSPGGRVTVGPLGRSR